VPGATPLAGFDERVTTVKACRMRYFVGGRGSPVVLVHGLTGAAANWSELAPLLARRHRVLVPDLPGHAGSAPLPVTPNLDAYADRVQLVAAAEGMLPAPVVGHSMGGLVARHPQAVSALVLAASAGIESSTRRARFWLGLLSRLRPGRWLAPAHERIAASAALRLLVFGPVEVADPQSLTTRAVEGFLGSGRLHTAVREAVAALVADDPRAELDRVEAPAFVLWGARDRQLPIGDGFELARRLGARFRAIADCGHLLIAERPEACRDAIESFLESLEVPVGR
jgi:pimeloyl-ACP methyl ester carboxylesterase